MLYNYKQLKNGLIKQKRFFDKKREYNCEYAKIYDSYGQLSISMSFLRLGFLLGCLNTHPTKILDIGYGNGDFLNCAQASIKECCGYDVTGYSIPEGCKFIDDIYSEEFDVVCFFDVLEHFDDIYDISKLKSKYIYISVPECHYISDTWFDEWKHRRPDEHLWHFNRNSLQTFMEEIGYELVLYSNIEDTIRKPIGCLPNILSGIFKTKAKYD